MPADLKAALPEQFQKPFLAHPASLDVLIYDTEVNKQAHVHSLWELPKPEWKGKAQFPVPTNKGYA